MFADVRLGGPVDGWVGVECVHRCVQKCKIVFDFIRRDDCVHAERISQLVVFVVLVRSQVFQLALVRGFRMMLTDMQRTLLPRGSSSTNMRRIRACVPFMCFVATFAGCLPYGLCRDARPPLST